MPVWYTKTLEGRVWRCLQLRARYLVERVEQSTPLSPIVFILSPGADPAGELSKLAEVKGFGGNRFKFLAMGQGQESVSP